MLEGQRRGLSHPGRALSSVLTPPLAGTGRGGGGEGRAGLWQWRGTQGPRLKRTAGSELVLLTTVLLLKSNS